MADLIKNNDIYTLSSYIIGIVVLTVMAIASFRAKKKAENDLRQLKKRIEELSKKSGPSE
ncbi:MAG: heme exporter protein CcmD [Alphaproteobacteria bacterium]|nr:heme exporter protein CcmD [Alphaproteobacteria bacterium]